MKLAAQHFGADKAPIVFGCTLARHQLGGGIAALATGVSRDALATYFPAFFAAGLSCLVATLATFALPVRPAAPLAAQ